MGKKEPLRMTEARKEGSDSDDLSLKFVHLPSLPWTIYVHPLKGL